MWNNYFFQLQKKYNMRISTKMPLIVRFDGRGVTRNKAINFFEKFENSFSNSLEKTAKYFSEKYQCFSIFGSDEISFIISNPNLLIEDLEPSDKTQHSQELIALFSQYFFDYFNHFDAHQKIFWHGKCFSIPQNKIKSYLKYRSNIIKNVLVTNFAIKNNIYDSNMNLEDRLECCKAMKDYSELESVCSGILYYNGGKIALNSYLDEDKFEEVAEGIKETKNIEVDIDNIDIELL